MTQTIRDTGRRAVALLIAILSLLPFAYGEQRRDSVVVSLITCNQGKEVYQLCGHSAVRVRGGGIDSVWNYGLFSFDEPNFVYRFVKGETDYMLGAYPFPLFMEEYIHEGRSVYEQDLNLSPEVRDTLISLLRRESLPQNCVYRYNYVRNNCATRIIDRVEEASGERIIFPDTLRYGTFRRQMRSWHKDYPWYQFGIDLALGSGLDVPLWPREEMFVPVDLKDMLAEAHFESGRPVVSETRVIFRGEDNATLPPTPFWLSPMFICSLWFLIAVAISIAMGVKKQVWRPFYSLWYGICGLMGCVIAFLVFISEHEATSPNILLLWLNPLQLLFAIFVWFRGGWSWPARIMAWYDVVVVSILLIVWPFQLQSANPAFFPLMGATVAPAIAWLAVKASGREGMKPGSKRGDKGVKGKKKTNRRK